jgi:putative membrane protein
MHRRLTLLAGAAILAAGPAAFAQTQQQRAQAVQGQTGQGQTGAASTAPAATTNRAEVVTGQEFMRLASMSDRFEVASSRLAQEKSQNAQVKQFAEHMVRDHTKTTQELQKLIQQVPGSGAGAATPLPNGRESQGTAQSGQVTNAQGGPQHEGLDQQHTALLQQLQGASGAEFDRLYIRQQISAHQQAVDLFSNYSRSGDNPLLKQWAAKTLPDLQEHLQLAQKLQQSTQG